jgi:hypothetical protein
MDWTWKIRLRIAMFAVVFCIVFLDWTPLMSSPLGISTTTSTSSSSNNKLILNKQVYSFPKWEDAKGINIDDVLAFAMGAANKLASTVTNLKTRLRFPETFHVLDRHGIWVSFRIRIRHWKPKLEQRVLPSERLMREGWRVIERERELDLESVQARWPRVSKSLFEGDGIPFLTWYGDYRSCNLDNWHTSHGNRSIPLFTPAIPIDCHHGFPMPNFKAWLISQGKAEDWGEILENYRSMYPWDQKIPKAIWRGSLSAPNEDLQSVRWRLCQLAFATNSSSLDVGLTSIPARNEDSNQHMDSIGRLVPSIPQLDFQKYTAIIDVDGNSWSSRFVELLCYNSVVIKVQPQFVEYFYQDLQPWVHYIPVKDDLSDLMEAVDFALGNPEQVQEITRNANTWCQQHWNHQELGKAFLDVLERYVSFLDKGDARWSYTWSKYKPEIFRHESFDMRRIE